MTEPNQEAKNRGVAIGTEITFKHLVKHKEPIEMTQVVVGFDNDGDPIPDGYIYGLPGDEYRVASERPAPASTPERLTKEEQHAADALDAALSDLHGTPQAAHEAYQGNASFHETVDKCVRDRIAARPTQKAPEAYAEVLLDFYTAYERVRRERLEALRTTFSAFEGRPRYVEGT